MLQGAAPSAEHESPGLAQLAQIGYDNLHLKKHAWSSKILAWEQLGDASFDLLVVAPPSLGLIPVDLPSPPIVASNITGPSNNLATEAWETVLNTVFCQSATAVLVQ
jgi:hypothetical protein